MYYVLFIPMINIHNAGIDFKQSKYIYNKSDNKGDNLVIKNTEDYLKHQDKYIPNKLVKGAIKLSQFRRDDAVGWVTVSSRLGLGREWPKMRRDDNVRMLRVSSRQKNESGGRGPVISWFVAPREGLLRLRSRV